MHASEASEQRFDRPARPAAATDDAGFTPASSLTLDQHGAVRLDGAALPILATLLTITDDLPADRAGIRLHGIPALSHLLGTTGPLGALAEEYLGPDVRPVRAILFDKTSATNWALGWHQDRTIVVHERHETAGFGPWTVKAGMIHVAPPPELLAGMLTMRVHLDDVNDDNAPLLIAPRSHALGKIAECDVDAVVERCGISTCLAEAGDVWLYSTPILHASAAAARPVRRRVLQVDFAARDLPDGLAWLGI